MRILVTGGAGYIGTELVSQLAQRDDVEEIVVYDNLSRKNYNLFLGNPIDNETRITFIHGDILDSRSLRKALYGIDTVYHLAARVTTPFADTDPHFYEQVNHWGTAEVVYAVENSDVKHVIFASSTSVYGSSEEPVDENSTVNPRTFYGISKYRGEQHVQRLAEKMPVHIFRCGNVYGYSRSMRFDAVINKFVFEAHVDKRISIHGNGEQRRSFIHVKQVARALSGAVENKLSPSLYNLVNKDLRILDIAGELKEIQPELEFIFINQHLKLRQLIVRPNPVVDKVLELPQPESLHTELTEFHKRFSF